MIFTRALVGAALVSTSFAKTNLSGCSSTDVSSPAGASLVWYVPGTGELCDFPDCGGGRAPPRTDVPGCPQYSGTATYSPSYMPGYGASAAPTYSSAAASLTSASWSAWETDASDSSWDLYTNAPSPTSWSDSLYTQAPSTWIDSSYVQASGTDGPLICALASPCSPASTSIYTYSTSTTIDTQTSAAVGAVSNGTITPAGTGSTTRGAQSGTLANTTTSAISSISTGAAETPRAWSGTAGLVFGLGAAILAL